MRNKPESATELLEAATARLGAALPADASLTRLPGEAGNARVGERDSPGVVPDACLELRLSGESVVIPVEIESRVDPRDVMRLVASGTLGTNHLLVSRHLSERTRAMLTALGRNFADASGNYRLRLTKPPVYVAQSLERPDPEPERRPLQSLKGAAAGRLVRALAEAVMPLGIRALATRAKASAAMASRVVELLDREAVITRDRRGPIQRVDRRALVLRWAEDYSFFRSNRIVRCMELRGRGSTLEALSRSRLRHAITGATAADRLRSIGSSNVMAVYTPDAVALAEELELERREAPTTVLLAEPFDDIVFERTKEQGGLHYVAPVQLAVDLLTSGDRYPQLAGAVLDWMSEYEAEWRV